MYHVVFFLLYLVSLLPLRLLYLLSDVLAFLLYYVIRYRRDVVASNLLRAFPEIPEAGRARIAKKFYRNFTDSFIETIKLLSASQSFMKKHFVPDNIEVLQKFYDQGRKAQLVLGHTFNWEVANVAMPIVNPYLFLVAYMPVTNKVFDRLFLHLRSRTGSVLLPATSLSRAMLPYRNTQYLLTLVADQSPGGGDNAYWLNFFGTPTPFVRGPERGARAGDIPHIFVRMYKSARGHYRVNFQPLAEHPKDLPEGELTREYCNLLEQAIRQDPDLWLWSHKRWKITWQDSFAHLWIGKDPPPVSALANSSSQ
jgi:KDO2-lipid IV(A) lauroyltransferase